MSPAQSAPAAPQRMPLMDESQYQANIAYLAQQHLEAQTTIAALGNKLLQTQAASESLAKQLKDAQAELATFKVQTPLPPIETAGPNGEVLTGEPLGS